MTERLPDRISLVQAALWLVKGRKPVSDERFRIAKVSLTPEEAVPDGPLGDLVVALHEGKLSAYSGMGARTGSHGPLEELAPRRSEDVPVTRQHWRFERVSWNESALLFAPKVWDVPREFKSIENGRMRSALDQRQPEIHWYPVVLIRQELTGFFPQLTDGNDDEAGSESTKRRGRKGYDWEQMYIDLVVKADLDGLPEGQAAAEQWALKWCLKNWNKEPSESTIRAKIAPIYNHPRKAGK